jgi:predicted permease
MAVISYAAWQRRFGGSPTVVGQRIRSESQSYTIVGVTPREFTGVLAPLRTDVWIPVRTRPVVTARLDDRRVRRLTLFGRMKDGIGAAQVAAELNGIDAQLRAEHGMQTDREPPIITEEVRGVPHPGNRRSYQSVATLLTGVVGMVLLIACVNVGNLLLVRGAARQREFALRGALGATRFRLAQQLFAESLVLALAGGVTGLLLAVWTSRLLERSVPPTVVPIQLDLALDWRVVVYALAISLVTTLLCGILPAGRLSRFSDGLLTVRGDAAGELSSRKPIGLVAQVVVSLVLLLVAGSFIESLFRLQTTDPGFKVDGRLYAYTFLSLPPFTPESGREFYSRAIERLEALPGVRSAALTRVLPLTPSGSSCVARPDGSSIPITTAAVSAGFFETMGIDIVAGRSFESDSVSVDTVIVNETLARRLWPSGAAIGERVMIGCEKATSAVVSGVARNSAVRSLGEGVQPHIYVPFAQQYSGGLTTILVETSMPAPTMVDPVRRALLGQGQGIRVYAVRPLEEHVHESYWPIRW